jgi:hypothetical protein
LFFFGQTAVSDAGDNDSIKTNIQAQVTALISHAIEYLSGTGNASTLVSSCSQARLTAIPARPAMPAYNKGGSSVLAVISDRDAASSMLESTSDPIAA